MRWPRAALRQSSPEVPPCEQSKSYKTDSSCNRGLRLLLTTAFTHLTPRYHSSVTQLSTDLYMNRYNDQCILQLYNKVTRSTPRYKRAHTGTRRTSRIPQGRHKRAHGAHPAHCNPENSSGHQSRTPHTSTQRTTRTPAPGHQLAATALSPGTWAVRP